MNRIKQLLVLFSFASLLFSCSKESGNNSSGGVSTGTLSAKIDGVSWSSGLAIQVTKSSTSPVVLTLSGSGNGAQMSITIAEYIGIGTYNINNTSSENSAIYTITSSNPAVIYLANAVIGSGVVTVTSDVGGIIEGSFQFEGYVKGTQSKKSITNGAFQINYN